MRRSPVISEIYCLLHGRVVPSCIRYHENIPENPISLLSQDRRSPFIFNAFAELITENKITTQFCFIISNSLIK